jgi:hypothetical protein
MEEEIAMQRIIIVRKGSEYFIRPPHTTAGTGEKIKFSAVDAAKKDDNNTLEIYFPGGSPLEGDNPFTLQGSIPVEKTITGGAGVYPFSAFCKEYNTFAVGGSFGELVVGP